MPPSSFLFLNNKSMTLPADRDRYKMLNRNTYKQEAFQFAYLLFVCKLYDMANLPTPRMKLLFYGGFVAAISTYSFYRVSLHIRSVLSELDNKYEAQYHRYIRDQKQQEENLKVQQEQQKQLASMHEGKTNQN